MGYFVFIFIIAMIIICFNANKSKENNSKSNGNRKSLEHSDCDDIKNSCLHIQDIEEDRYNKVCKNCGHRNDQKSHKCSVCGKRLF